MKTFIPSVEQVAIAQSTSSVVNVKSHAGTGKTTALALTIKACLDNGVHPKSILALAYTEAGVLAIKRKLLEVGVPAYRVKQILVFQADEWAAHLLSSSLDEMPVLDATTIDGSRLQSELAFDALMEMNNTQWGQGHYVMEQFCNSTSVAQMYLVSDMLKSQAYPKMLELMDEYADIEGAAEMMGLSEAYLRWALLVEGKRIGRDLVPKFRRSSDYLYDLYRYSQDGLLPSNELKNLLLIAVDEAHDLSELAISYLSSLKLHRCQTIYVGDEKQRVYPQSGLKNLSIDGVIGQIGNAKRVEVARLSCSFRYGQNITDSLNSIVSGGDPIFCLKRKPSKLDAAKLVSGIDSIEDYVDYVSNRINGFLSKNSGSYPKSILLIVPQGHHLPEAAVKLSQKKINFSIVDDSRKEGFGESIELRVMKLLLALRCNLDYEVPQFLITNSFDVLDEVFGLNAKQYALDMDVLSSEDTFENRFVPIKISALKSVFFDESFQKQITKHSVLYGRWKDILSDDSLGDEVAISSAVDALGTHFFIMQYAFIERSKAAVSCIKSLVAVLQSTTVQSLLESLLLSERSSYLRHNIKGNSQAGKIEILLASAPSSKGLEAEMVIVGPVNKKHWSSESKELELNRLYVSVSRAIDMAEVLVSLDNVDLCLSGWLDIGELFSGENSTFSFSEAAFTDTSKTLKAMAVIFFKISSENKELAKRYGLSFSYKFGLWSSSSMAYIPKEIKDYQVPNPVWGCLANLTEAEVKSQVTFHDRFDT